MEPTEQIQPRKGLTGILSLSGPFGAVILFSESVGFTYGYSRYCPSGKPEGTLTATNRFK